MQRHCKRTSIFLKKSCQRLKDAKLCPLYEKGYSYYNDTEGIVIVLDCVFNVQSVEFKGQARQSYESLDDWQKKVVNELRCHAYEKREDLQRICIESNQISVQAQPPCPSSVQQIYMQSLDITAENRGEQMLHVNKSLRCSPGLDDGFQVGSSELHPNKLDETMESLRLLIDEGTRLDISNSFNEYITDDTSSYRQAGMSRMDKPVSRSSRAIWKSVKAVVMFKTVFRISVNQGGRASKRQRYS